MGSCWQGMSCFTSEIIGKESSMLRDDTSTVKTSWEILRNTSMMSFFFPDPMSLRWNCAKISSYELESFFHNIKMQELPAFFFSRDGTYKSAQTLVVIVFIQARGWFQAVFSDECDCYFNPLRTTWIFFLFHGY